MSWFRRKRRRTRPATPTSGIFASAGVADVATLRRELADDRKELNGLRLKVTELDAKFNLFVNQDAKPQPARGPFDESDGPTPRRDDNGRPRPLSDHERKMVELAAANPGQVLPLGSFAVPPEDDE